MADRFFLATLLLSMAVGLDPAGSGAALAGAAQMSKEELRRQIIRGLDLFDQAKYREAIRLYEQLLPVAEALHGKDDLTVTAKARGLLASLYLREQPEKAEPLFLYNLQIVEWNRGKDHVQVADVLHELG